MRGEKHFVAELAQSADVLPPIAPATYPAILEALMAGKGVRPRFGKHPRLHILGPLEARLQRLAPVSQEMTLNYLAQQVLGYPAVTEPLRIKRSGCARQTRCA